MDKVIRQSLPLIAGVIVSNFLGPLIGWYHWDTAVARSIAQMVAAAIFFLSLHAGTPLGSLAGELVFSGATLAKRVASTMVLIILGYSSLLVAAAETSPFATDSRVIVEVMSIVLLQLFAITLPAVFLFSRTRTYRRAVAQPAA